MTDGLSRTYADLLEGQYDCLDRIVLNAYFRFAHSPRGFRTWWRQLFGSDHTLDQAHLKQGASRFRHRLRSWARANQIPLVRCQSKQAKHELAEAYLQTTPVPEGIFLVLESRAPAPVWEVLKGGHIRRQRPYPFVTHFSFHILDPDWGHLTIKISSHPPFPAQIILNGHNYLARQALQQNVSVVQQGNCFVQVPPGPELVQLSQTFLAEVFVQRLTAVCDRWIYSCIEHAITAEDRRRTRFRYDYSTYQLEYSRNLLFQSGAQMAQVAEALFDRNRARMDVPRLKTIFGKKNRPHHRKRKPPVWQVTAGKPPYDLSVFKIYCGKLAVKIYTKGERVLRIEAMAINTRDLKCGRSIERFAKTTQAVKAILERFLEILVGLDHCFVTTQRMEQLSLPARVGRTQVGGIDLGHPRMSRVAKALVALTAVRPDFTASDLARQVQRQAGRTLIPYSARQAAYDLQKFCAKGLVQHEPGDHRYRTTPEGLRLTTGLLILRERVLHPVLSALEHTPSLPVPSFGEALSVDMLYQQLRFTMAELLVRLGFSTPIHNSLEIAA